MKSHDICNAVVFFSLSMITVFVYQHTYDLDALWILALMVLFTSTEGK